jgi:aspartate dehydrogenase
MQVAVIGAGAIGSWVIDGLRRDGLAPVAVIVRRAPPEGVAAVGSVDALPAGVTHLIDCAGHSGLAAHGPAALAAGIDVVTLSLGALADAALAAELASAAEAGNARLHLASGAIGALDALRAAEAGGLTAVRYTGTKAPAGWAGSPAEAVLDLDALSGPAVHFDGTAREAARRYPKNANVAAAVAIAGIGFDATQARLVADPAAEGNTHLLEAEGTFGRFRFEITGAALPESPRSSALAAMSALAEIRRLRARVST